MYPYSSYILYRSILIRATRKIKTISHENPIYAKTHENSVRAENVNANISSQEDEEKSFAQRREKLRRINFKAIAMVYWFLWYSDATRSVRKRKKEILFHFDNPDFMPCLNVH